HEEDANDENHPRSLENLHRLQRASDAKGRKLDVIPLPFPRVVIMDGMRLPASYANFYMANGVCLVPTFNDRNDRVALNLLADLMPRHEIVGIHAVDLVWGLGTLHCLSQQQPAARSGS
ncbi:MAG: agmatine deiminase family protein, partial [Gemmatimonas sp.]